MRIYVVVREFQNGSIQNEFAHTSIKKSEEFIENDDWDGTELYIETWENGKRIFECPNCHNEVDESELETTIHLKPICKACMTKLKLQ